MKEFFRIILIFFLVCGIVFFSYNIYSFATGRTDNIILSGKGDIIGTLIDSTIKLEDSGIDGSDYEFDTLYHPYYGLLNSGEKKVYKQIYANALELKSTFVPVSELSVSEMLNVIEAVINDHPELFWLGNTFTYKYNNLGICKQITLEFNGSQNDKSTFYNIVNEIVANARHLKTDYEREVYVHDVLMEIVEYDEHANNNQTAYSALVGKKTVCAGYARAFQYIMMQLGIPTYYVTGYSDGEDHAWNIVKLDDQFYNVDVTWDDELNNSHTLFNKTDEEFNASHSRSPLSSRIVRCNGKKYDYRRISNNSEVEYVYEAN